jgi:transmembrane sensor
MSEIDWELLDRYLAYDATPEERARVEAWLAEDLEHWAQLAALRDARERAALSDEAVEQAKVQVWARIAGALDRAREQVPHRPSAPREFALAAPRRWNAWAQLAAALVLVIGGALALRALRSHVHAPAPIAMRIATTGRGERTLLHLPDGTPVMLGVASTLRYPVTFGARSREVLLEGEAYFEVVHDERRPFVVRAGELIAKDLGTEFTVRAYPEESRAQVVVREGRVSIRAAGSAIAAERMVAPGELGRLGTGNEPVVEPADTALYFAWTEGRLVFDRTPLREALPELGRWFDLDFRLADTALGGVPLTATLTTQPTPEVLANLAASLGLRMRREGRRVTLYSSEPSR